MTYNQLIKLCKEFNIEIGTFTDKLYYNKHVAADFDCSYISPTVTEYNVTVYNSYINTRNYDTARKALSKRIKEIKMIEIHKRLISFEKDFV